MENKVNEEPWDRGFIGLFVGIAPACAAITAWKDGLLVGVGGFAASMTFAGVWWLFRHKAWDRA